MGKDISQETYQQAHRTREVKTTYCFLCKGGDNKAMRERGRLGEYAEVFFLVWGQNITDVYRSIAFALGKNNLNVYGPWYWGNSVLL